MEIFTAMKYQPTCENAHLQKWDFENKQKIYTPIYCYCTISLKASRNQ